MRKGRPRFWIAGLLLPVCLAVPAPAAAEGGQTFRMDHGSIAYYGRWDTLDNGGVQLNFQSGLEVIFTGTSAAVGIGAGGNVRQFMYSIDGAAPTLVTNPPAGDYSLASGLADGDHTLSLYSAWESTRLPLSHIRLDTGAALKPVPERKTIEFIGDSITAGWIGNSYVNGLRNGYTWQTAQKLGFAYNVVARGTIGLIQNGNDTLNMSERYFKSLPFQEGQASYPPLDASRYQPDYIVVNLGTNDRSYPGSRFQTAYTDFLAALRDHYPGAAILALRPLGGRDITGGDGYFKKEILSAVNARRRAGDKNVAFLDTTGWVRVSDFSDSLHFNYEGNQRIAERLAAAIAAYIDSTAAPPAGGTATEPVNTPDPTDSQTTAAEPPDRTDAAPSTAASDVGTKAPTEPADAPDDPSRTATDHAAEGAPTEPAGSPAPPGGGTRFPVGWIVGIAVPGLLLLGGGGFALWRFAVRKGPGQ